MSVGPGDLVSNKYRIVRLIGDGGMGTVFEARHEVLGTRAALKFLHPDLTKRSGLVARFTREAQVSARIQSPHVARVTDVDQLSDGTAYIVMELLSGESLQHTLDRERKLPRSLAIDYALQILSGLEAAHAIGVVHRDLKPDNVFITPSAGGPILKLFDFGIAKIRESEEFPKGLTRPGSIMGTPEYMAPEQAYAADQVDQRADLYSVGAMLFEMLTGERPASGNDAHEIVEQVMNGRVKRLTEHDASLDEALAEAVHRAMDPVSTRRFASALEMRAALAPFAGELSHAGRLAATPIPVAVATPPEDDDPKGAPIRAVPRTLPPEDAPPRGTAVAEPPQTHAMNAPAHGAAPYAGYGMPMNVGHAPPPERQPRASGALLALVLGVAAAGIAIAIVVVRADRDQADDDPPVFTAPPVVTLAPKLSDTADPPLDDLDPGPSRAPPSRPLPGVRPPGPRPSASAPPGPSTAPPTPAPSAAPSPGLPLPPGITLPPGFASAIPPGLPTFFPLPPGFGGPPPAASVRP